MKSVVLNLALIVLIALFSLPLLTVYVLIFFGFGGGWAYAGTSGCHFVIGPIGYAMLIVPAFALFGVGWKSVRKVRRRP